MAGVYTLLDDAPAAKGGYTLLPDAPEKTTAEKAWDVAKSIPSGIAKGATGLAGLPGNIQQLAAFGMGKLTGQDPAAIQRNIPSAMRYPTSQELLAPIETAAGGQIYQPQTTPGKYASAISEGVVGNAIGPAKALPLMLTAGGVGGASGEAANELLDGKWWARPLGNILGATGTMLPKAVIGTPGRIIKEATQDVTPAEWAAAQKLQEQSQAVGVPLLGPEALPRGPVQQLASDVLASKSGGRVMEPALAARPGQVQSAVGEQIGKVAPEITPNAATLSAQKAATDYISAAEKARTAAAEPLYGLAEKGTIPAQDLQPILNNIDTQIAKVGPASESGKALAALKERLAPGGTAETAMGPLSTTYRETRADLAAPSINASGAQKTAGGVVGPVNEQLKQVLEKNNAYYQGANKLYSDISKNVVDPLIQSDVGKVAGKGFDPQTFPTYSRVMSVLEDPKLARPVTIKQVYTALNAADKSAFPSIARVHLENAFDTAAKDLQSGANRMGGANFRNAIMGTAQQKENFRATLQGVAKAQGLPEDELYNGFMRTMDVLDRTGRVPGIGSQTAGRLQTAQEAASSRVAGAMEMISANPLKPVAQKLREWTQSGNYKQLAQVFTSNDSVQQMRELAQLNPYSAKAQLVVANLLGLNRSTQEQPDQTEYREKQAQ